MDIMDTWQWGQMTHLEKLLLLISDWADDLWRFSPKSEVRTWVSVGSGTFQQQIGSKCDFNVWLCVSVALLCSAIAQRHIVSYECTLLKGV